MMVCLLVAGVVLSELGLRGLRVRRVLPPAVHAGTPYLMGIALENRKRRLPSFSIEVEDLVDGRPIDKRCYFLKLPAGRAAGDGVPAHLARRGRYRLSGFRLATKFPFGLVPRTRAVADADELLVYPALIPAPEALLRGLPAHPAPGAIVAPSRQGEFRGLRAFRAGDDPRDIHWRTSARRGIPLVRENEDEEAREATVVLDNSPDAAADAGGVRARGLARRRASASSSRTAGSASASPCAAARCRADVGRGAGRAHPARAGRHRARRGPAAAGPRRHRRARPPGRRAGAGDRAGAPATRRGCAAHEVRSSPTSW